MANFNDLTNELAAHFDLGPGAEALVHYVLDLIAAERDGLNGFLKKFEQAGLGADVEIWRCRCGAKPLSVRQVKKVLGAEVIKQLAKNLEVPQGFASKLLGHAIPPIIGRLTAESAVSEAIPSFVPVFPGLSRSSSWPLSAVGLPGWAQIPLVRMQNGGDSARFRLVTTGVAVLLTLAVLGYAISSGVAVDHSAAMATTQGPNADIIEPASVARTSTGDTGVQAEIKNPKAEPDGAASAAAAPKLTGTRLNSKERTARADSARVIGTLGSFTIHFPPKSAKIPPHSHPIVRRLAAMIEKLPAGTMVQIDGYADSTGSRTVNMELSQRRADSVDLALIHAGVDPAVLSPRGLGTPSLSVSANGTSEPQSNDRRVEVCVVQQHS